ncbi:MAG TPA: UDP-N-acetylglucosamine 1-carboxyvinyltransferase [Phycisphaerales bacterium]|nr:UDP-N-acetylglucosamine 1-carboxyvinyltransferase [Phycisphaerales bacterium]HIB00857.1 UDP-N-acetylglucosamine 1-carboxyvinyltransferase [Phycisphaerales bacterium]HIB51062.1 UDP-N-acetylglucosamine 1-carboxyvinyltransferase [Phycisphaerales bacterium]HIN84121.1 UDP-N-acetylglucosamine 1-carboxyvinyltransferase [Phycisphaerales bacterium]HIO20598.1 UDP-N-acetylglucosamine 1-carboxyvinyltransferase [Phycisphaerales bacterium]
MDAFSIHGGQRLTGSISVDGSKNASLPLLAASLLTNETVTYDCVPELSDIANMGRLLEELGCNVSRTDDKVTVIAVDETKSHARYDIVRTMRASVCVLGPLLARRGEVRVSMPGGCAFGDRPIDLHLRGLEALGAKIELDGGNIIARADRLQGATIFLGGPFGSTVLGTANVMSAATLAKGRTIIESAACEPEITDLANLLNAMGAKISGAGTPRITINGVEELGGATHTVMPDRIVAGTWAIAAAMTNGDVEIERFPLDHLLAVTDVLSTVGVHVNQTDTSQDSKCCTVQVVSERHLKPVMFTTQPFPGFPTDLQAQMMALLCLSRGNSIITEKIYPERFMHVPELSRMGAKLVRQGATVIVQGVDHLVGAPVMASDLRASASLVLAGLAAEGETIVSRVYHLDRGYSKMEKVLTELGANIKRIPDDQIIDGLPIVETVPAKKLVQTNR